MSETEDFFDVEEIVDKKYNAREDKNYYLIKWEGFSTEQNTWEPEENLTTIPDVVEKFERNYQHQQKILKKKREETLNNLKSAKSAKSSKNRSAQASSGSLKIRLSQEDTFSALDSESYKKPVTKIKRPVPKLAQAVPDRPVSVASKLKAEDSMDIENVSSRSTPMDIEQPIDSGAKFLFNHCKVKGNIRVDRPAKILGCKKVGNDIFYVVLFCVRKDGVIPEPCVYSQKELKGFAPYLLSDYWIENAIMA